MVYITGDIHGAPRRVVNFAKDVHISRNDTLIILGDFGGVWYGGIRDKYLLDAKDEFLNPQQDYNKKEERKELS